MYLIYKADNFHSYASRDLIGCTSNPKMVIEICQQEAKKENHKLSKDDLFNLNTYQQTQGYSGEGEFNYEAIETDVLL